MRSTTPVVAGIGRDNLEFAQGNGDCLPSGPQGRRHPTDNAHDERENDAAGHEYRCDLESECQVREGLPVHSAGGESVERKNGETSQRAANTGYAKRFEYE